MDSRIREVLGVGPGVNFLEGKKAVSPGGSVRGDFVSNVASRRWLFTKQGPRVADGEARWSDLRVPVPFWALGCGPWGVEAS